jgi:motility quorum-sensing regulator / GCU-specific mRNA interferase toxin
MEKRTPHYSLNAIKAAFADPHCLNRTVSAEEGACDLEMNETEVVAVIQALSRTDFDKSMTSIADYKVWQDVYKPIVAQRTVYVKFTLDNQKEFLLISFKEA